MEELRIVEVKPTAKTTKEEKCCLRSPYARSDRPPPREYKQTVAEQARPLPNLIKGQRVEDCIQIYAAKEWMVRTLKIYLIRLIPWRN